MKEGEDDTTETTSIGLIYHTFLDNTRGHSTKWGLNKVGGSFWENLGDLGGKIKREIKLTLAMLRLNFYIANDHKGGYQSTLLLPCLLS